MNYGSRSLDALSEKHKAKIADVSNETNNGDGWWIYLKPEYADLNHDPYWNCRTIHEQTLGACIGRLRGVKLVTPENTNEKL